MELSANVPALREVVRSALKRRRQDRLWFVIGTVVFTPIALLLSGFVLLVAIQWLGVSQTHSGGAQYEAVTGLAVPNLAVLIFYVTAASGAWRSPWVTAGGAVLTLLPLVSFATGLEASSPLVFWLVWSMGAIVGLTLTAQASAADPSRTETVVTVLPNAVVRAYGDVVPLLRRQPTANLDACTGMVRAIIGGDQARQRRLSDAARSRGEDLERVLVEAKLARRVRERLTLGDAVPEGYDSNAT